MADDTILAPPPIEPIKLKDALEERYLAYALSTIMQRALPDVRDGLKPVHRRLLYAMRQLRLDPTGGFKKCARVVGDVIGKYHPHGDQSVYDALVRLAQDFAQRYPLVDGQGNFGNIDGDNAAAMRYTEAKLTPIAAALLDGIDEDTVDFRETYDGEEEEPVVLPASFPNLLANGSSGIAVGMATSIPPHNLEEVCDAALYLVKHPKSSVETLLSFLNGPDFPTGGILVDDQAGLVEAYKTGRGSFRLRARWHVEDTGRGTYQIIVTEIPYGVQKSRLIEKMADLLQAKKLPLLGDVDDEVRRGHPHRHRAEVAQCGCGAAHGAAFQADGARGARAAEHDGAVEGACAAGSGPWPGAAGMARPPQGGAAPPLRAPAEADRAPARSAGRPA